MKRLNIFSIATCLILTASSFGTTAQVQELAENKGAAAAWQALLRLRSTVTALHITAHPDDEDAALLTWLARGQGVRTGLLTLNRGEGGANLIGPELYDALGVLRTEELLAAGRYYGLDRQMFTRVADFGFSKRLDETLEHWGKELTLGDVVRAVRMYRPDVIISRFHGKARDGHGNHQSAGLLAIEAFRTAADQNRFPEQFNDGLRTWQAKKLYLSMRENEPSSLKIDVGEYDPLLGRSYREVAGDGYRMHRSQSAGQNRPAPGSSFSAVQLIDSATPISGSDRGLFDSLNPTILGLANLAGPVNLTPELTKLNNRIETAINKFDARRPWAVADDLAAGMKATRALIEQVKISPIMQPNKDQLLFLLANKEKELNDAMNKSLGLVLEVLVDPDKPADGPMSFFTPRETFKTAIPGQTFSISSTVVNRSRVKIAANLMTLRISGDSSQNQTVKFDAEPLGSNGKLKSVFKVIAPEKAEYTRPYWSRANELRDHLYQIERTVDFGLPFSAPDFVGGFNYEVDQVKFNLDQPAQTIFIDPPYGEQRRLLTLTPAINVGLSPRVGVVPIASSTAPFNVTVTLSNNVKGNSAGKVRLKLPAGWTATPSDQAFSFSREGEVGAFNFKVAVPHAATGSNYQIQAVADYNGREYAEGYQVIAHRDLEPRHLYRSATMEVRGIDVKVAPNLTVGYVMGVGDEVPKTLEQIGVKVVMLGGGELAGGNLDQFDAIVVGIRASAVRDDLKAHYKRLLEYAERGGNLIYQYQTPEFDDAPYGPYPYKLTPRAEEVSEEDAQVTILDPTHAFFNWPNKITAADFDGWVEERGSKWMSSWDNRYLTLLECNDRGQAPQRGGLVFANYGAGTFTYAAYAFYRQLPAGVQGGYRLFANIISLKKEGSRNTRK